MNTKKTQRKKRFKRDPSVSCRLTERDFNIINEIYRYRFLSSEQIISLFNSSRQGILRRLNLLYHAGHIDRPKAQLNWFGNHPIVYALGNEGARLLSQRFDVPLPSVDWTTKNREVKGLFLEHTLMVSSFMVQVRLACRQVDGIEFIGPGEIIDRRLKPPSLVDKPLSWKVDVQQQNKGRKRNVSFSIVPDSAFALRFIEGSNLSVAYYFLEADRSTMPIKSNNLRRSSFYKKMIGYYHSWKNQLFSKNFGFRAARILTVTLSPERIESMISANQEIDPRGNGLRMFLFAPENHFNLNNPDQVLKKVWLDGRGDLVSILD